MFYQIIKVGKDESGWCGTMSQAKLQVGVYFSSRQEKMINKLSGIFAIHKTQRAIFKDIDQLIADLYNGKKKNFDLSLLIY